MKYIFLLSIIVLGGCSSTPPPPPEPKGEIKEVNPSKIDLVKLYLKVNLKKQDITKKDHAE